MGNRWDELEELFVSMAGQDLARNGEIDPLLGAFSGEDLQFLAWLRPFGKGAYHDPLIELCALAMPLGADRLAFASGGRLWSMDDPIPPVCPDADLRQRGLIAHFVDGTGERVRCWSVIHPFDVTSEGVRWQEPTSVEGGRGWILDCLAVAVRERHAVQATEAEIGLQALRVDDLGHQLYMAPEVLERLSAAVGS